MNAFRACGLDASFLRASGAAVRRGAAWRVTSVRCRRGLLMARAERRVPGRGHSGRARAVPAAAVGAAGRRRVRCLNGGFFSPRRAGRSSCPPGSARHVPAPFLRADIRLKHTEGFNPHPVMAFALPLSRGHGKRLRAAGRPAGRDTGAGRLSDRLSPRCRRGSRFSRTTSRCGNLRRSNGSRSRAARLRQRHTGRRDRSARGII
jgi:hypothetical protein